jgi:hypothetical protein
MCKLRAMLYISVRGSHGRRGQSGETEPLLGWLHEMSSHLNGDALRQRAAVTNGSSNKTLIPTNSVTTKDGVVKVRIDPTLMVVDVVKQLVANLQIKQSPSDFALRDEDDELVTNENLRKMIKTKAKLK